jgi:hypothetical protein
MRSARASAAAPAEPARADGRELSPADRSNLKVMGSEPTPTAAP